jgi:hypothetical protein
MTGQTGMTRLRWPVRPAVVAGVSAVVMIVAAVGVASAAIPDAGTAAFHGCQNKATGIVRLVDPSLSGNLGHCITTTGALQELAFTFNQTGPVGPAGGAGPTGATGAAGPKGDRGEPGIQGPPGTAGLPGAKGIDGIDGKDGLPGKDGTNGIDGKDGTNGIDGKDGTNGIDGKDGTNGIDGKDGVGVVSASLAAGDSDCPNGGSRFTAANGTSFACNGSPGASGGVAGQDAFSSVGSGTVTISPGSGFTQIPGLTMNIVVPAGSFFFVTSTGGAATTSTATNGFSVVDIALALDGHLVTNGGFQRLAMLNTAGFVSSNYWSIAQTVAMTPGAHTIAIFAEGTGVGSAATVSGDSSSVFQGTLDVLTLKR